MITKPRRLATVLLAGALSTVSFAAAATPADALLIRNYGSGMCAGIRAFESHNNGATVVQQPCTGQFEQQWQHIDVFNGNSYFRNYASGMCMDVRDGVNADSTPVQQWTCTRAGIRSMTWKTTFPIPVVVPSQVKTSLGDDRHRCLDVRGGSAEDGAVIQIYHCTDNNPAQAWTITVS
jgi:hypothetical protein